MKQPSLILLAVLLLGADFASAAGLSPGVHRRLSDIRAQMDAGKLREGLPRLQRLLREVRGDPYARAVLQQHLGYAYLELEQPADARRELTAALESGSLPHEVNRRLHRLLAQIELQLDRPQQALAHVQAWLQDTRSPTPEERAMAAQVYYDAGKPGQAIAHLEQAIDAKRPPPEGWQRSLLGLYLETSRHKQARRLLKRLLRDHPNQADYWRYLAQLEMQLGRQDQALGVMALAYEQGLLDAEELTRFARLYAAAGIPDKAARLLQEWRETSRLPVTLERLRTEANLWLMARERDQALNLFEQAARRSGNGRDDFERGCILFDTGRWTESARSLQRAIRRGGLKKPAQARLLLGIAAFQAGNTGLARGALQQAMDEENTRRQAQSWLALVESEAVR